MINWKALPRERGIYQITTGSVSYIGLSDNIQLRVKQHLESSSCRSRIILDTKKPKVVILELLPNSDDKTLALREWHWFYKFKRKGHILVNDPKTLGKTKSGQYFPPKQSAPKTSSWRKMPLGCGVKVAGVTAVIMGFFSLGYLATGQILQQIGSNSEEAKVTDNETNPQPAETQDTPPQNSEPKPVEMQPLSACIRPLKPGRSRSAVEVLQKQLQELAYYEGPIDGDYGPGTKGAVSEFQRDHDDLNVDGIVGCETQTAINDALR